MIGTNFIYPVSDLARKNYSIITDLLTKLSYKPGWEIRITENPSECAFVVTAIYDSYESKDAAFFPLGRESNQVTKVRERLSISIGKTIRHPEKRCFSRRFNFFDLDRMPADSVIRYVIADTIKQAEMAEFDRWFKFDGDVIFGGNS